MHHSPPLDSRTVHSIHYTFHILIAKSNYTGVAEIHFHLQDKTLQTIHLNFIGDRVKTLRINGKCQQKVHHQDALISLPTTQLLVGLNKVIVEYTNLYDTEGHGLTYLADVDGSQYVYTHFEPEGCRNVFPCFDEPHLKATMELVLFTPSAWISRSNEKAKSYGKINFEEYRKRIDAEEQTEVLVGENLKNYEGVMWLFAKTPILPTYCFAFIAGQYLEITCPQTHRQIPMSLLGMKTYFHRVEKYSKLIWRVINCSIKFYENLFKVPYCFSKSDHVFVYELQVGAMQNAGLILYSYNFLQSSELTPAETMNLCAVIAHELAHQWFGNLVTLKRWSQIWLNEGFAQFLGYFCLSSIKDQLELGFNAEFMNCLLWKKGLACRHDKSQYTHPVLAHQIKSPMDVFDKITYVKGAYLVKQLVAFLGDSFWRSINKFLSKYSWNNASVDELVTALEEHNENKDLDLMGWKQAWMETRSYNVLEMYWNQFLINIEQKFIRGEMGTYKNIKVQIAFFKEDFTYDVREAVLPNEPYYTVSFSQNYKGILLDCHDDSFIQRRLDPVSRQFFRENIKSISDPLMQGLLWKSFYQELLNGQISSYEFLSIVIDNIHTRNEALLELVFNDVVAAINTYTPYKFRWDLRKGMVSFIRELMKAVGTNNHLRSIYKKFLIQFSGTTEGRDIIKKWYFQDKEGLIDQRLTVSERWKILRTLAINRELSQQQTEIELNRLNSEEPSYILHLQQRIIKGLFYNQQQAELVYWSITHPNRLNCDLRESIIYSYRFTKDFQQKKSLQILAQAAKQLSESSWIHLFNNLFVKSDKLQQCIFDCEELLKIIKDRQRLSIAVCNEIVCIQERMAPYQLFNSYDALQE